MVLDLVNASVEKDPQTSDSYVVVKLSNPVNKILKEAVNMFIQKGFGDSDDMDKVKLREEVKQALMELHRFMNPS